MPSPCTWNALDDFVQKLQWCDDANHQVRHLVESVRTLTGADAVIWYWGGGRNAVEISSELCLPTNWCRHVAKALIVRLSPTESQALRRDGVGLSLPHHWIPVPQSAAMVRASRRRGSWIIAISFRADSPMTESTLRCIRFAKRVLNRHREQVDLYDNLKGTLFGLIQGFTAAIDAKDPYTSGHSERVARMAVRVGQEMSLGERELSDIYLAGLLHDIGKIGIRDQVLRKPGKLDDEERRHIQEHPLIGDRILSGLHQFKHLKPGVRSHHERYDGQGYPDRLIGDQSPKMARILAVVDACDAMLTARHYRPPLECEVIEQILTDGAGTQWDPVIVKQFMSCREDLYNIAGKGLGESVVAAVEQAIEEEEKSSSSSLNL